MHAEPPFQLDCGLVQEGVAGVAARLLRPGGWVCAEHAEVQHVSAPGVFVAHGGFDQVRDRADLNGRPRFVTARRAAAMAGWPS